MQEKDQLQTAYRRAINSLVQRVSQSQEEGLLPLAERPLRQFNNTIFDLRTGALYKALEHVALVAQGEEDGDCLQAQRQTIREEIEYILRYLFQSHFSASMHQTAYLIPKEFEQDPVADIIKRARLRIGRSAGLLRYKDAEEMLDISHPDLYLLISSGRLHPIIEGRDRWLDVEEVTCLQAELEKERKRRRRQQSKGLTIDA